MKSQRERERERERGGALLFPSALDRVRGPRPAPAALSASKYSVPYILEDG